MPPYIPTPKGGGFTAVSVKKRAAAQVFKNFLKNVYRRAL
jgi:hypothetical protein